MPIKTAVDSKERLVRFTVAGPLDSREMIAAVDSALSQLDDKGGYAVLSDHRLVETPATPEQVRLLMEHISTNGQRLRGARCGVVVGSDASYGMMRLMSVRAEQLGINVGVFRDVDDALTFIRRAD